MDLMPKIKYKNTGLGTEGKNQLASERCKDEDS